MEIRNLDQELIYQRLKVEYKIIHSKDLQDILVKVDGLPVAVGILQFLELVAVMEGFLANQLPPKKERYKIAIKDKIPYLGFFVKKYNKVVYLDKAETRVYLKILKQFERAVNIIWNGRTTQLFEDKFYL